MDKDSLENIRIAFEESQREYEAKNDAWWTALSETEREDAFYAVCKRIHRGDMELRGTYRYVLYDVFGFDPGMYMQGMNCGYFNIHNALFDADELQKMKDVTRLEVIDETGRVYSKWLDGSEGIKYNLQDDDRTLKVFIDKTTWKEQL